MSRYPAPWRSRPRPPPGWPELPRLCVARTAVPSSWFLLHGCDARVDGDDEPVSPSRGGALVVVFRDERGDRLGQLRGEGGPFGGRGEVDLAVHPERGEPSACIGGGVDEAP